MKASIIISALMAIAVTAVPAVSEKRQALASQAKRQLSPPPPGCGDTDTYARCAAVNSIVCYNPLPLSIAECYTACQGCCDEPDNPDACNLTGI